MISIIPGRDNPTHRMVRALILNWAFAWPSNRRIMYNRASADTHGQPWSERKRYLWWDAEKKEWVGKDKPDFSSSKSPDYQSRFCHGPIIGQRCARRQIAVYDVGRWQSVAIRSIRIEGRAAADAL